MKKKMVGIVMVCVMLIFSGCGAIREEVESMAGEVSRDALQSLRKSLQI